MKDNIFHFERTSVRLLLRIKLLITCTAFYAFSAAAEPLTLDEALQLAEQANPTLEQARAELIAAQGGLEDTLSPLWNNPEVFAEIRSRDSSGVGGVDVSNDESTVGLSQTFELGGQQRARRSAARQNLAATEQGILQIRRQIRGEVQARFFQVLSLQQRIESERETVRLVQGAAEAVKKRVAAGEDSRLQGNLAIVEAERAQNQISLLREQLTEARANLAATLQLPADSLPEVRGSLEAAPAGYTLEGLLESATNRPGLRVLELREQQARSQVRLERAEVIPDLTLGLSRTKEVGIDSTDEIIGLSVSLPLPIFQRNATGISRAFAYLTQTQIERRAANRGASAQVFTLWKQLESLRARAARLQGSVVPRLEENLRLSTRSYQAGEIGLTELLLVNRQALEARRDLLDALTSLRLTRSTLEVAAGLPIGDEIQ